MSGKPSLSATTAEHLHRLGYEQLAATTWRNTTCDVMAFVSVHDSTEDPYAIGHLTKRDAGNGATAKPYSQSYRAPYKDDIDAAVRSVAEHMLVVAEEHAIAGTVRFQRFSGHGEAVTVASFN